MISELFRYISLSIRPGIFPKKTGDRDQSDGVIISMTTLPSRIANIAPTISSLIHQTIPPEKILINLPAYSRREQSEYKIPKSLIENPWVEINNIEDDLGPATKLLPALKKYQNQKQKLIIVADDDEIYPKKLVENYLTWEKELPGSVLTLVGWDVPKNLMHSDRIVKFGAIGSKPPGSLKVDKPTRVDCVQGASTFAVRPAFFSEEIFDYTKAPKEAFFVDDIYVSAHLAKRKIPVFVIPAPFRFARMKVVKHLLLSETLHKKENKTGNNNNTLYEFYQLFWASNTQGQGYSGT